MFLRSRILLLSSVAVTVLLLIGVVVVSYDAMTIRAAEEVEEDTGKLLLNAERWLNHQAAIETALRDYVLFAQDHSLQVIAENRLGSEEHIVGMKEALSEYEADVDEQIGGLLRYKDQHQRLIDEIVRLRQAGDKAGAAALLAAPRVEHYMRGAGLIVSYVTQYLQDQRTRSNSEVSTNVLRGSVSFAAMALIMIAAVWFGYAINRRTQMRNEELSAKLAFEATHDALTGLPNRRYMRDHLSHAVDLAVRHRLRLALSIIDLDGFKAVNDTYGHEAGDRVLNEVARRFKRSSRTSDFIVRMGGDEFAVISENVDQADSLQHLAQRLIDGLADGIEIQERQSVSVGCSIGIAIYPDHGADVDALFAAADRAMYAAKAGGRNQWRMA